MGHVFSATEIVNVSGERVNDYSDPPCWCEYFDLRCTAKVQYLFLRSRNFEVRRSIRRTLVLLNCGNAHCQNTAAWQIHSSARHGTRHGTERVTDIVAPQCLNIVCRGPDTPISVTVWIPLLAASYSQRTHVDTISKRR